MKGLIFLPIFLILLFPNKGMAYQEQQPEAVPDSATIAAQAEFAKEVARLPIKPFWQTEPDSTIIQPEDQPEPDSTITQPEDQLEPDSTINQTEGQTVNPDLDTTDQTTDQTIDQTGEQTTDQTENDQKPADEMNRKGPFEVLRNLISPWKITQALLFGTLAYIFILFASRLLYFIAERNTSYRITIKGIVPLFRIIFWTVIVYIIIAGIFKPDADAILALGASIGVAVGFASQDILKNIFGGIVILIDRPFIVGDKIEVGEHYGEVIEIGLRTTRIVTPDDSTVALPNSNVMNSAVSNANSGETNCQVVAEIYLPINVDTRKARKIALEAAKVSSYVYLNKPVVVLFVNVVKERRSYLKMRLKAYVMELRHEFAFKSDMTETVVRELLKQGLISPEDVA